jgi:hypothetical protein
MTLREEYAAMVARIEPELAASGAGCTPKIRALEDEVDTAMRAFNRGTVDQETVSAAIRAVEIAWHTEIARARRLAQGGVR